MRDRFTRGFIAGIGAGILLDIISYISFVLNLNTLPFYYWAGFITFSHTPPFEIGEALWAIVSHLIFSGGLGIIFAYLLPKVTSENLLFKGWTFGVFAWFIIYAITFLLKAEGIVTIPLRTAISNFVEASIFGIVLAIFIEWLTNKYSARV